MPHSFRGKGYFKTLCIDDDRSVQRVPWNIEFKIDNRAIIFQVTLIQLLRIYSV